MSTIDAQTEARIRLSNIRRRIAAALCFSSQKDHVFLFAYNKVLILKYSPDCDASVVHGISTVNSIFPSLKRGTFFAEWGVTCAFGCLGKDEAFLFQGNLCVKIRYGFPPTSSNSILEDLEVIDKKFPFLEDTPFECGFDAAFESTTFATQAYIFRDEQYALIDYGPEGKIISYGLITELFPCLEGTMFSNKLGAAFVKHDSDEVYLFKDDYCIGIYFNPLDKTSSIIESGKSILTKWPCLRGHLPCLGNKLVGELMKLCI